MTEQDIKHFLVENIEPLEDFNYGIGYRAAAYLTDGTFLPCVMFRDSKKIVELAMRRFKEERKSKGIFSRSQGNRYAQIVKNFVTNGNCINYYDIERVEKSRFAMPEKIMHQIKGETTMGWTGFVLKMNDDKHFAFGTKFHFEFFDMPDGYQMSDISEIISHSYISVTGKVCTHQVPFLIPPEDYNKELIYREKIFFECFLDGLI